MTCTESLRGVECIVQLYLYVDVNLRASRVLAVHSAMSDRSVRASCDAVVAGAEWFICIGAWSGGTCLSDDGFALLGVSAVASEIMTG